MAIFATLNGWNVSFLIFFLVCFRASSVYTCQSTISFAAFHVPLLPPGNPGPKIRNVGLPKSAAAISVSSRTRNNYRLSRVERSGKQKNFPGSSEPGKFFCGP